MRYLLVLLVTTVLFSSCDTEGNKHQIVGKWHAVSLENPILDERMKQQKNFIDTFGNNTTEAENLAIYEFTNIDSAKQALMLQMEGYIAEQEEVIKGTIFEFEKDGTAILHFREGSEDAKWEINENGKLVILDMVNQNTETVEMDIITLNDSVLTLKMLYNGVNSTVVFEPVDK